MKKQTMVLLALVSAVAFVVLNEPTVIREFTLGDISVKGFSDGTSRVTSPRADAAFDTKTRQLKTLHRGTPAAALADLAVVG